MAIGTIEDQLLKVYQEIQKFLAQVMRSFKPEIPELHGFYAATSEADFVFPPEIREYLDEVFSRANKLRAAKEQYRDSNQPPPPSNYDHVEICDIIKEQMEWFLDQHQVALEKFKRYMDISK